MDHILSVLIIVYYIFLVITAIYLLLDNREPSSTIAWLVLFILFPVLGFIAYVFFGRSWKRSRAQDKLVHQFIEGNLAYPLKPLLERQETELENLQSKWATSYKRELMQLLANTSNSILTANNRLKIFHHGKDKFDCLLEDLNNAKAFIHMEYYIWRHDELGQKIKAILIERAKKGVEVRILYDSWGCMFLSKKYIRELRGAGIDIYPYFNFLSLFTAHTLNYRNHRKLVIIDGTIGYNGGVNIGDEYINGGKFKFWRDTHLRVEGEATSIYQAIFTIDWYNTTKKKLFDEKYYRPAFDLKDDLPIQISTSGPDSQWLSIKQLYFALIKSAEKHLFIQSAYFIPDPSIFMALKTAALSGIEVKIMITGVVDHWLPYWSAFTYFEDLLQAGVRIFHYKKGLMHAKTISIDSQVCSIGTANLDIRSFHLNYETNTLIYEEDCALAIERQFMEDLKDCREFTLEDFSNLTTAAKLRNSLARLFAPLL
ncbi:MAG TPA: cardiolipin synthase [Candidatus Omnitrophota bacterium]|nr:cardiolipin synthase [Candidatus Omnitrophota bacterium]